MIKNILIKCYLLLFCSFTIAQVGMPTSEPKGALDLNTDSNTNTYGLVLPTTDNPKQKIRNPQDNNNLTSVNGTVVYDSKQDCVRIFQANKWSNCLCTKGDEGCMDYYPGQGGVLPWLIIHENSFGHTQKGYGYDTSAQAYLEQTTFFGTNGIYNKYERLHVGRSFSGFQSWIQFGTGAGQHPNYLVPAAYFGPDSYKGWGIASVHADALGNTQPARIKATHDFTDAGNILFITLYGSSSKTNTELLRHYGLTKFEEHRLINVGMTPTIESNGPFKYEGKEEIEYLPQSMNAFFTLINCDDLPQEAIVYATRSLENKTYAAIFSIKNVFFFDTSLSIGGSTIFHDVSLSQIDARRQQIKHRNMLYNITTKALDMLDVNKVFTPNPIPEY